MRDEGERGGGGVGEGEVKKSAALRIVVSCSDRRGAPWHFRANPAGQASTAGPDETCRCMAISCSCALFASSKLLDNLGCLDRVPFLKHVLGQRLP